MRIELPKGMTAEHCQSLEDIRVAGYTNMYGAAPYLAQGTGISDKDASKYLEFWMQNYQQLIDEGYMERG
jgi:hypothetical protein